MITIIDYGMGNLGSIENMFRYLGVECQITSDINEISESEKILLPGVGSFDAAMKKIHSLGIKEVLDQKALVEKVPILGICLGMQLLTRRSDEGKLPGLGYIGAETLSFKGRLKKSFRIPHMGWNVVKSSSQKESRLIKGFNELEDETRFYFVHSYFVATDNIENSLLKCKYDIDFDCGIHHENILGVQFHPEKSHKFGMKLLKNFSEI